MLRTWPVRLVAMALTESVRSFHVPATPRTSAWPPSLPSVPDFARDARDFRGKAVELVDHRIDGVLELENLALDIDRDLLRQIPIRDRRGHIGDVAHLAGQI